MLLLANVLMGLGQVLYWVLNVYWWILIARAVVSWVSADPRNPIVSFLYAATEPPLRLIRRRLPTNLRYFPLDIAFLVLLGLVIFAQYGLVQTLLDYAAVLRRESLRRHSEAEEAVKLTPMDVQRQGFARRLRGLDPDEVRTFLSLVAEEMAALQRERDEFEQQAKRLESPGGRAPRARDDPQEHAAQRPEGRGGHARDRAQGGADGGHAGRAAGRPAARAGAVAGARGRARHPRPAGAAQRAAHRRARPDRAADPDPRPAGGSRGGGQPALPQAPRGGRGAASAARPARHGRGLHAARAGAAARGEGRARRRAAGRARRAPDRAARRGARQRGALAAARPGARRAALGRCACCAGTAAATSWSRSAGWPRRRPGRSWSSA